MEVTILVSSMLRAALGFLVHPRVHHLIVYVTERCPLRCRTCFVGLRPPAPDPSIESVTPFLRALGPVTMVDIGGGEPFLRDDLPAWCALFPTAVNIGIPTSGWQPETVVRRVGEVLQVVPPKRLTLSVSLDGFEATNDALRGPGSFDRALETLRALLATFRERGLQVKVNTVLCRENADELAAFMEFIAAERPMFHSILLLRGRPRDADCRLPSVPEIERLVPDILRIQEGYGDGRDRRPGRSGRGLAARAQRHYPRLLWYLSLRTLRESRQAIPCLAGRAHLVLYANGDVAPCELLPPVGNIHATPPDEILCGPALRSAVQSVRTRTACFCTHNCNMVENVLFNPRTYPRLLGWTKKPPTSAHGGGWEGRLPFASRIPHSAGPSVSVIIPSYRRPADLARCLSSLRSQSYQDYEVVVVDDASPERAEYERVVRECGARLVRQAVNRGQAAARNRGVAESRGELLLFLDDDCTVEDPDWIVRHVSAHDDGAPPNAPAGLVGGRNVFCTPTLPARAWASVNSSGAGFAEHLEAMNLSLSRRTFERLGPFREDLRELEDVEFSFRARALGVPLIHAPDIPVLHHYRTSLRGILRRAYEYGEWTSEAWQAHRLARHRLLPRSLAAGVLLFLPLTVGHTLWQTIKGLRRSPAPLLYVPLTLLFCIAHTAGMVSAARKRKAERPV
jgi:GT2 family glycosyltransferase/MoaA/NifB/PqqE/SkfB family radical SAM enzyme